MDQDLHLFHDQLLGQLDAHAPEHILDEKGQFKFGRFKQAVKNPCFKQALVDDFPFFIRKPSPWNNKLRSFRLKEWHYTSVNTTRHFFGMAIVQLGYAAQFFFYIYDKQTKKTWEFSQRDLTAKAATMALSSLEGTTLWERKGPKSHANVQLTGNKDERSNYHDIKIDLLDQGHKFKASIRMTHHQEALGLSFPLARGRAGYTHKEAGNFVHGHYEFDDEFFEIDPHQCAGVLDWTRSYALRKTRWNWASIGALGHQGNRFGLNLSRHVYDHPVKGSMENVLWVDGRIFPVGEVEFIIPQLTENKEIWKLKSHAQNDHVHIDLTFTPVGHRKEKANYLAIKSDFIQPFGQFNGVILHGDKEYKVQDFFGVMEKHLSVW